MSLPPEIIDCVIDFIHNQRTLEACSLVSKSWVARSRMWLFHDVVLFSHRRWQKIMPTGDASPARYTRKLTLAQGNTPRSRWINTDNLYVFLHHLLDFKNVQSLVIDGWVPSGFSEGGLKKYFSHFGRHLRSLELSGERMTPDSFLVLLGHLPGLEDLSLKERVEGAKTDRVLLVSPKLSGRLTIRVHKSSIFSVICQLPLRFREICLHEHGHDYQELINACAETLVDFRAMSLQSYKSFPDQKTPDISFDACGALREVTIVKNGIKSSNHDLTGIVSSITSKHIQRIVIGFAEPVSDAILRDELTSKTWEAFDDAITHLAERTLNNGQKLQLELHVCGSPSMELFDRIFSRFVESGNLKVVKTSYIWTAFISGPSTHF